MVDQSDLIAASVYSWKLSRAFSSNSSLRKRRGSEVAQLQNRSGCPHHSLGLSCAGVRPLLPRTGHDSARPSTEASGPPAADASGTTAVDVLGLSTAKVAGLQSPTSATTAALYSWPRTGRSGMTAGGDASTIPTSAATGGSTGESTMIPAGVDAGTSNKLGRLRAATASAASPGGMAAPTWGLSRGGLPRGNSCRLGPPPEGALRRGQPTGMLRRSTGRRSRPCLKSLRGGQTSQALPPLVERKREQVQGTQ
jgi:hypothetical protein